MDKLFGGKIENCDFPVTVGEVYANSPPVRIDYLTKLWYAMRVLQASMNIGKSLPNTMPVMWEVSNYCPSANFSDIMNSFVITEKSTISKICHLFDSCDSKGISDLTSIKIEIGDKLWWDDYTDVEILNMYQDCVGGKTFTKVVTTIPSISNEPDVTFGDEIRVDEQSVNLTTVNSNVVGEYVTEISTDIDQNPPVAAIPPVIDMQMNFAKQLRGIILTKADCRGDYSSTYEFLRDNSNLMQRFTKCLFDYVHDKDELFPLHVMYPMSLGQLIIESESGTDALLKWREEIFRSKNRIDDYEFTRIVNNCMLERVASQENYDKKWIVKVEPINTDVLVARLNKLENAISAKSKSDIQIEELNRGVKKIQELLLSTRIKMSEAAIQSPREVYDSAPTETVLPIPPEPTRRIVWDKA